jgi:hypothetical protein
MPASAGMTKYDTVSDEGRKGRTKIFAFAGHASIMKNLLRKDLMEGISCRETSEPMPWILEGSGVHSPLIGNRFHSYLYRASCKGKGHLYISLSFS